MMNGRGDLLIGGIGDGGPSYGFNKEDEQCFLFGFWAATGCE